MFITIVSVISIGLIGTALINTALVFIPVDDIIKTVKRRLAY